jgi:MHS family proline/betaine transporter-like MFS transporter
MGLRPGSIRRGSRRRQVLAATLGNALEWYDFAVYGALASTLGRVFFPASDPEKALLQSFTVFALGYLMRPVGSLVLGPIGDRIGRRTLLLVSMAVMAAASTLIGLLPTQLPWGLSAGWLLILLRMLQGFSLGGEYTGSITYVVEAAPPLRRGRQGALPAAGSLVGLVGGSLTAALVQGTLAPAALEAWGWRLPFLLAGLLALVALVLRRGLPQLRPGAAAGGSADRLATGPTTVAVDPAAPGVAATLLAEQGRGDGLAAFSSSLRRAMPRVAQVLAILAFEKVSFYLVFVFWVQQAASLDPAGAAAFNGICTLVQAAGIPLILLAGRWADQRGPVRMMRRWCLLLALLIGPASLLLQRSTLPSLALGLMLAGLPLMLICGTYPALVPFLFEARSRCTAFSVSYSLGGSVLGGTAPALAAWMVAQPGWGVGPLLYPLAWALPALLVLARLPEIATGLAGSEPGDAGG